MKKKVLIVDDSNTNNILLESILFEEGIDCSIAFSGNEALDQIKTEKPGLILLDIMMPGVDGFMVLEKIKNNTETKDIPVVFITARNDDRIKEKALNAGATDFIQKPIDVLKVVEVVKNILLN